MTCWQGQSKTYLARPIRVFVPLLQERNSAALLRFETAEASAQRHRPQAVEEEWRRTLRNHIDGLDHTPRSGVSLHSGSFGCCIAAH